MKSSGKLNISEKNIRKRRKSKTVSGKGDRDRVSSVKRYRKGYDAIKWLLVLCFVLSGCTTVSRFHTAPNITSWAEGECSACDLVAKAWRAGINYSAETSRLLHQKMYRLERER